MTTGEITFHDPLIVPDGGQYYCFSTDTDTLGVQRALSPDLLNWKHIAPVFAEAPGAVQRHVAPIPPGPRTPPERVGKWSFWAPELVPWGDEWRLYFCSSGFGLSQSMIGLAAAKRIGGDFEYRGDVLKTYDGGAGTGNAWASAFRFAAPNAIDPNVVRDRQGRPFLVYGSFFAGIFIAPLNDDGFLAGPGYGRCIAGGQHSAVEGAYVIYDEQADRFCLFFSRGSLLYDYRICAAYAGEITGPYTDSQGLEMTNPDPVLQPGDKIAGGYNFDLPVCQGFMAPGHNSVFRLGDNLYTAHHIRREGIRQRPLLHIRRIFFSSSRQMYLSPVPYDGTVPLPPSEAGTALPGNLSLVVHDPFSNGVNYGRKVPLKKILDLCGDSGDCGLSLGGRDYAGRAFFQNGIFYITAISADGWCVWGQGYDDRFTA
jgi:arabinan endo-1,5-alpha-L-arabinosidase